MLKLRLIVALFLLFSGSLCASSEVENLDEGEVSLNDDQLNEQNSQVETEASQSDAENSEVETENSQSDAENSQVEAENSQEEDGGVDQNAEYSEFNEDDDDVDDDDRSDNGQQSIDFSQTPQDLGVLITIGDSPDNSQVSRLVKGAQPVRVATRAPRPPPVVATKAPRPPPVVATKAPPRAPPQIAPRPPQIAPRPPQRPPQIAPKAPSRRPPAAPQPANCQTVCPATPRVQFVTASVPVWDNPISGPAWREVINMRLNLTRRSTVKLHGNGHGFSSNPGHSVDVLFFVNNQICGLHGLNSANTAPGNHISGIPLNTGAAVFHSTSWVAFQVLGLVTLDAGVHQVGLRARCRPNGRGQVNGLGIIAEIHPL